MAANLTLPRAGKRNQAFALLQHPLFIENGAPLALAMGPAFRDQLGKVAIANVIHGQQR